MTQKADAGLIQKFSGKRCIIEYRTFDDIKDNGVPLETIRTRRGTIVIGDQWIMMTDGFGQPHLIPSSSVVIISLEPIPGSQAKL